MMTMLSQLEMPGMPDTGPPPPPSLSHAIAILKAVEACYPEKLHSPLEQWQEFLKIAEVTFPGIAITIPYVEWLEGPAESGE